MILVVALDKGVRVIGRTVRSRLVKVQGPSRPEDPYVIHLAFLDNSRQKHPCFLLARLLAFLPLFLTDSC